jgi:MFS transporter, FHS family, L-fucose permease
MTPFLSQLSLVTCTYLSDSAIFFWPPAKFEKYSGFVDCTLSLVPRGGCQLVHHRTRHPALRCDAAQYQPGLTIASFATPLIASSHFFKNAMVFNTLQWVRMAISGLGVVLNVLFL